MRDIIIPARLNGYEIIAAMTSFDPYGDPVENEIVIMGHDPSRRSSKYVTAFYKPREEPQPREWYWGHYYETIDEARSSLINRSQQNLAQMQCRKCHGSGTILNSFGHCDACVIEAARIGA